MTEATQFGWLGEARRTALHALLVRQTTDWSRAWWMDHSAASIDVYALDEWPQANTAIETHEWSLGDGILQLCGTKGNASLGAYLAGHHGDSSSPLADAIGKDSLADLTARLGRCAGRSATAMTAAGAQERALHRMELGSYMAQVSIGGHKLLLAMDRRLVDLLAPPKQYQAQRMTGRGQALENVEVLAEACMPLGTISLPNLESLRVGEVLVGDALLSTPLEIRMAGGTTPIAFATLGRADSRRAITLVATP